MRKILNLMDMGEYILFDISLRIACKLILLACSMLGLFNHKNARDNELESI